ncbi:MAG: hypothetical protein HPY62_12320, partial [Bacteroidales bacterium]|nr:hypothetical protein [Bacteroidales bacterium]
YNPAGYDTVNFYATTHVGFDGNLADEIPSFNNYLAKISSFMRKGSTYSEIAVYLPLEDAWCRGVMPEEKQFIWAWGYYEMRYVYFPEELKGFCPTWINREFLEKAHVDKGILRVGNAAYKALYIDAEYLDYKLIKRITELSEDGLRIIIKKAPKEPGAVTHPDFGSLVQKLMQSENVSDQIPSDLHPLIEGKGLPPYWCRKDGNSLYIFFANPKSGRLKFPLEYGQSFNEKTDTLSAEISFEGKSYPVELIFEPYQSLLYEITRSGIKKIDISFVPEKPAVRKRPEGYEAPWLVK